MKKPIKTLIAAAAMTMTAGSLAGCGDNFNGLEIVFWHTFGGTVQTGVDNAAKSFAKLIQEKEGFSLRIKSVYKGSYDDLKGYLENALAIGDNPTIAVAYPDHIADYFEAEKNAGETFVVNLKDYMDNEEYGFGKESFLGDTPTATFDDLQEAYQNEAITFPKNDGGAYVLPFLKSTELLLYNPALLRRAIEYTSYASIWSNDDDIKAGMSNITWPDFMDLCDEIKSHSAEISSKLQWPLYYDSDSNLIISSLIQKGIPYSYVENGHGYIGFDGRNEPETSTSVKAKAYRDVQDTLKDFKEWHDLGLFETRGVDGSYGSKYFEQGACIFTIGSTGGAGYSFPATSGAEKPVAVKVPFANNNPSYVSQGVSLALFNNVKMKKDGTNDNAIKYGWKFLKYITNPDLNADLAANHSQGYNPVRKSAISSQTYTNFLRKPSAYADVAKTIINDIAGRYFNTAVFKGSPSLRDEIGGAFADVMRLKPESGKTIKSILDNAISNATLKM